MAHRPPTGIHKDCLKWFLFLTAAATFLLVWVGGLVTSHGAGLAVPDWPNTYGYNMFFFPISQWMGGIFYEHTHRLIASGVGLLTTVLTLWLFGSRSRPVLRWGGVTLFSGAVTFWLIYPANIHDQLVVGGVGLVAFLLSFFWPSGEPAPAWQRYLALVAFAAVVVQGVLGGLRVTELMNSLGIVHGTVAQLFFLQISIMALFRTRYWGRLSFQSESDTLRLRTLFVTTTVLIVFQLMIGATMRHQHAGLAIPDFPLAYGKLWPDLDAQSVLFYNQQRMEVEGYQPITAFQIVLQLVHRFLAVAVFGAVWVCWRRSRRACGKSHPITRWVALWLFVVGTQGALGAATIWTGKSADIATLHVAVGALSLLLGGLTTVVAFRVLANPTSVKKHEKRLAVCAKTEA